jgi:hypothetical protein
MSAGKMIGGGQTTVPHHPLFFFNKKKYKFDIKGQILIFFCFKNEK